METRDCTFATQTSFLGWNVQGIWSKGTDFSEVNSLGKSHGGSLLATADEFGEVKLFKHPCIGSGIDKEGALKRRPKAVTAYVPTISVHSTQIQFPPTKCDKKPAKKEPPHFPLLLPLYGCVQRKNIS